MMDHGYLEGIDAAMGMHVWPTGPAGQVLIKDGELMASCDNFKITVHGISTHGSMRISERTRSSRRARSCSDSSTL